MKFILPENTDGQETWYQFVAATNNGPLQLGKTNLGGLEKHYNKLLDLGHQKKDIRCFIIKRQRIFIQDD